MKKKKKPLPEQKKQNTITPRAWFWIAVLVLSLLTLAMFGDVMFT